MEPEARYTTVGASLLALVIALVLAMGWLTRTGARADYRYYTIYFERQSLEGLQVGGDVNIRGIKVGRVEDYSISRENINRVQVTIRIERKSPVSTNTVAGVDRNLLTGLARINLATPSEPGPELVDIQPGEKYPVIAEGQSDMEQLADAVNRLAVSGVNALSSVEQLLNKENREAFGATLANLSSLSSALAQRMGKLDEVADTIAKSSVEVGRASRNVAIAAEQVSASVKPLAIQADSTLRELARAAQSLEREVTVLAKRLDQATDVGAHEMRATAQELRASAEALSRVVDRFQDPRALIFGPSPAQLGPGEQMR